MITVYVITSLSSDFLYVGMTNDLERRLKDHNRGYNRSTKYYAPFQIIYSEEFANRVKARKREKYLKSHAGKRYLRKVLDDTRIKGCAGLSLPG